ncbi:beta strand repeat-containing protein [Pseudomonas fluorescens]|uniref:Calcium-binding protein n=1 Tax=Pseudomonas fluorescens TaxID=294 RepID=A0A5E6WH05_PSEFL|nr:calcium-binding protein [Pseudomonas fluorescens]VVN27814.1 hypothetical protein PS659_04716 [Pseudomonas fluorescens]
MSSTADTVAPKLTSLTIPKTVNLASGAAGLTIGGLASDDGSGVEKVVVYFDRNFTYSHSLGDGSSSSYNFLGNYGIFDSWSDGVSSQTWGIAATNTSGTYNVSRVAVEDVQGNTRSYFASELASMGVNTSINFINSTADVTPPRLTSLTIPTVVDLSSGTAGLTITGLASDDGSGVEKVVVYFDRNFTYSHSLGDGSSSSYNFLGNYGIFDSWSDGVSSQTWGIAATNTSGTYNVTRVAVEDVQGNTRSYFASELASMGVNTSINFINSTADVTPPRLTSLNIPTVVDLSSGTAGLTITGLASDERSGVEKVVVYFDKSFTYSHSLGDGSSSTYNFLGNYGIYDSWSDGASSQTWGIAATNTSGTYNITRIAVEDVQGNTRSYSASELAGMGVNTSILMVANKSVLTPADDSRVGTVYADWLLGIEGNDRLNGLDGDDLLDGGAGNDVLDGGTGSDKLTGGLGNDTYYVDSASDVVSETSGSGGIDTVISSVDRTLGSYQENLTLSGTTAIYGNGNSLANTLIGNSAANVLNGGVGVDTMIGGLGNDTYHVDHAGDVVSETSGSGGIDTVFASVNRTLGNYQENLTLSGTAAINGTGNSLANTLKGSSAANVLNGGLGADTMIGGLGNDTYHVDNAGDVVSETSGSGGIDTVIASVSRTLGSYQEHLILSGTAAINGTGNSLANTLTGNGAANVLNGGVGADVMIGGLGNDTYHVDNAGDVVSETSGSGGIDTVFASVSRALGSYQENLTLSGTAAINGTGNNLPNTLTGNSAANVLNGGGGADTMIGGLGNDTYHVDNAGDVVSETSGSGGIDTVFASVSRALGTYQENLTLSGTAAINGTGNNLANMLTGNSAANVLNGGGGDDRLSGGAGNDFLVGGAGKDVFTGGAGNDIFDFNTLSETGLTSPIWDVISDFQRGSDRIDLATLDANTATAANDAFNSIIGSTTSFTAAGQLKVANGVLYGNTDVDSTPEFAIQLIGIVSLATSDFIL